MRISTAHSKQQIQGLQAFGALSRFRHWWVYAVIAALLASNVFLGIALYKSPQIAKALSQTSDLQISAYENRIAYLRTELDRLHSRQNAKSGDINLQLQELVSQQELLIEQHDYVRTLADKAKSLGLDLPSNKSAAATLAPRIPTTSTDIAEVTTRLTQMQNESLVALQSIAKSASDSSNIIAAELKKAGYATNWQNSATGGPYIPAQDTISADEHIDAANAAMMALARFQKAKAAISDAPIFRPLASQHSYSSRFGNRKDPFTGRKAFHSGLDFRAPSGTKVRSLGAGKVIFAGRRGGYGNTVEIKHSNGMVSRYAHLSKIRVKVGASVNRHTTIGLVGSTGRSTGPHLHLEVRSNDKPLDPHAFIRIGSKLAKYL